MLKKGYKRKLVRAIRLHTKGKTPNRAKNLLLDCKTIIAEKNKEVSIERFYQWKTYENVGCGLPSKEINLSFIEQLKERAINYNFNVDSFYLIEPEQKKIDIPWEHWEPFMLPKVSCIALLYFEETNTELVIGWFQDDFSFPSNTEILSKIRNIPWSKVSSDAGGF